MPEGITLSGYMRDKYQSDGVKRVYLFQLIGLSVLSTGVQLLAGSRVLSAATGLPFEIVTVLLAVIALSYSAISGIKASMLTDAIQMVFMLVASISFLIVAVRSVGGEGIAAGINGISGTYTSFWSKEGIDVFLSFGLPTAVGLLSGPFGDQSFWQRAFAVKKEPHRTRVSFGGDLVWRSAFLHGDPWIRRSRNRLSGARSRSDQL